MVEEDAGRMKMVHDNLRPAGLLLGRDLDLLPGLVVAERDADRPDMVASVREEADRPEMIRIISGRPASYSAATPIVLKWWLWSRRTPTSLR